MVDQTLGQIDSALSLPKGNPGAHSTWRTNGGEASKIIICPLHSVFITGSRDSMEIISRLSTVMGPRALQNQQESEEGTQRTDTVRWGKHHLGSNSGQCWVTLGRRVERILLGEWHQVMANPQKEICKQTCVEAGGEVVGSWRVGCKGEGLGFSIKMPLFSGERIWHCKPGLLPKKFCSDRVKAALQD